MKCEICEIGCRIPDGGRGKCGRYGRVGGRIRELYPDRYLVVCPISIETMPMLHFYPGGKFLQISTTGCNFDCPGCISTVIVKEMSPHSAALKRRSAARLVREAVENGCLGIAFLMNDPLASFHSFTRVAMAAKKQNLLVGCSTNGYFTEDSLRKIMPYLDFVNIGFKGFNDAAYSVCGAPAAAPVLRNMELLARAGVHLEVSCMFNRYDRNGVLQLAGVIKNVSADIPLQIMRYIPLEGAAPELEPSIRAAEQLRLELKRMLKHVYLFNSPGVVEGLNTYCPDCGRLICRRDFYGPMGAKLLGNAAGGASPSGDCPSCGADLNLSGIGSRETYWEGPFQGGYPFTRALEMVEAMLIAMGVKDKETVVRVWEEILIHERLASFERNIQRLPTYLDTLLYCGEIAGCMDRAKDLAGYIGAKADQVRRALKQTEECPRVYYAMGKPLFAIKGERMENRLVEMAGGRSINRSIEIKGRPGMNLSAGQLNRLNPEVILISAFISSDAGDFYDDCRELGIDVDAVRNGRVHNHPATGWDFGSPRWILGLMHICNVLHPEQCRFDITAEARTFYKEFYDLDFVPGATNRSFGKPDIHWRWPD